MKKIEQRKYSQYLIDFLMDKMPSLSGFVKTDGEVTGKLFSFWKDSGANKGKVYPKADSLSSTDIEDMKKVGYIRQIGDKLQITGKGSTVIMKLILGDNRSSYEDDGKPIDMSTVSKNIYARSKKTQESNWWGRFEG